MSPISVGLSELAVTLPWGKASAPTRLILRCWEIKKEQPLWALARVPDDGPDVHVYIT